MSKLTHEAAAAQVSLPEIDLLEKLIEKVGGKFALTTLIQRRMIELNRGAPPLVEIEGPDVSPRQIVYQEIYQGKIELVDREDLERELEGEKRRIESAVQAAPAAKEESEGEGSDVYGTDIKKRKEQRIKELAQLLNPKK